MKRGVAGTQEAAQTKRPVGKALVKLIRHSAGWYWQALGELDDPRDDPLYSMEQVVNLGVLMFACRMPSLRKLDKLSDDATFRDNWCALSRAKRDTVVCPRQMTNVLAVTGPGQLGALRVRLVKGLIRQKQLPDAFLLGHLMAVSDGTGIYASSEFHCSRCLTQRHQDGSMT